MKKNERNKKAIAIFEGQGIRRHWDGDKELWYFSVVDVIRVLTESVDARKYWNKLAQRLRDEGSEVVTYCHQLKMQASDGKFYNTDVADTEVMLRLVQSIPSKNAEPFKLWLARVGYERLEETADPELAINRALETYLKKGYGEEAIVRQEKEVIVLR
jgi:predicted membrane chloride channel (bestrophin family)